LAGKRHRETSVLNGQSGRDDFEARTYSAFLAHERIGTSLLKEACHAPRKRGIQYSVSWQLRQRFGLLDYPLSRVMTAVLFVGFIAISGPASAADSAFQQFLQSAWPDAQKIGVSRATFDAGIRGLEPDLTLPDLAIPGRAEKAPQQAEFVQTPGQYLREPTFERLAAQGKQFATQYKSALARIEKDLGVPGDVVLAIWARETDYGREVQGHDALQVLATQAYTGKRKDFFRNEFLYALKMLQDGVPRPALVLGRRHGADAVPAVGVLQVRGRFRR
jgi:membrane-bound lytic murein transglycosylase B